MKIETSRTVTERRVVTYNSDDLEELIADHLGIVRTRIEFRWGGYGPLPEVDAIVTNTETTPA